MGEPPPESCLRSTGGCKVTRLHPQRRRSTLGSLAPMSSTWPRSLLRTRHSGCHQDSAVPCCNAAGRQRAHPSSWWARNAARLSTRGNAPGSHEQPSCWRSELETSTRHGVSKIHVQIYFRFLMISLHALDSRELTRNTPHDDSAHALLHGLRGCINFYT